LAANEGPFAGLQKEEIAMKRLGLLILPGAAMMLWHTPMARAQMGCVGCYLSVPDSPTTIPCAACCSNTSAPADEIGEINYNPGLNGVMYNDPGSCGGLQLTQYCQQSGAACGSTNEYYESACANNGNCCPMTGSPCLGNLCCGSDSCVNGICTAPGGGGGGGGSCDSCDYDSQCSDQSCDGGCCVNVDPIVIDLSSNGFALTNEQNGVAFNFFGNGVLHQVAWTAASADVGWLALDRNGNGKIDDGEELFSNVTPQPSDSPPPIGFKALAVYDLPANGGNGDGWIDAQDAVYRKLLVWVDKNHNGISDPGELMTLQQAGIKAISVSYAQSNWVDAYGNQFRYRSQIVFNDGHTSDNWAYDVVLAAGKM
jgi:hypothetical protein